MRKESKHNTKESHQTTKEKKENKETEIVLSEIRHRKTNTT